MTKKGSSLIIALLMLAVISTASFGIARLTMVEMATSATEAANTKAYYLAEGGMEENLLRWRYDHSASIGPNSTESSKVWERIDLTNPDLEDRLADKDFTKNVAFDKDYIGTTIYNKVSQSIGANASNQADLVSIFNSSSDTGTNAYVDSRPDLKVTKDNKITFSFYPGAADEIDLVWRWQRIVNGTTGRAWSSTGTEKFGVEARLYRKDDSGVTLLAKQLFSPTGSHNILNSVSCDNGNQHYCQLSSVKSRINTFAISGETYLTLTPIGADVVIGAFGYNTTDGHAANYIDSITHLESVGVTRGRYKGLQVKLDKNSGRILGLYDYVLFEGSE